MTEQEEVAEALRRNTIVVGSRLSALAIYGYLGVTVGLAMMLCGSAVTIEQHWGTSARFIMGIPAVIGGSSLLASAFLGSDTLRGWSAGLAGTLFLGAWGVIFTTAYIVGALERGVVILGPSDPIPPDTSVLYPPFLYTSVCLLILLHLVTLLRLRRPRR